MASKKTELNNYRFRKIENKFLITSDHGSWTVLNENDFNKFRSNKLEKGTELFKKIEEKGLIVNKETTPKIINDLRKRYCFLFQGTSLHIVVPTLRCNMKCVYCHASSRKPDAKGFDMDKETAKRVVDFIFQSPSHMITIEFQGGEPLLNFDILKFIVDYAEEKNQKYNKHLHFNVVSNLTLMDKEKLDYLIEKGVGICTSFDGPKKIHNFNRPFIGGTGSYEKVKKEIKNIQKEYENKGDERKVNSLITLTKNSLNNPQEIVDAYIKEGLTEIHLRPLNNLGCAKDAWDKISYSAEEFIKFWKGAMDYIIKLNKKGKELRERMVWIILKKAIEKYDPGYADLKSPCGAALGQMVYNFDGDIYTCDEGRMLGEDVFLLGNVKNDTYKEVLGSDNTCSIMAASTNDVYVCDACAYKPYCGLCPVCNYSEQGSIITNVPKSDRCKILMAQFDYVFDKLINDVKAKEVLLSWLNK